MRNVYLHQYIYNRIQLVQMYQHTFSAGIYLLKVSNGKIKAMRKICSKLMIKTPERRHWRIVKFEQILYMVLVFLLNLNKWMPSGVWLTFSKTSKQSSDWRMQLAKLVLSEGGSRVNIER